MNHHLSHFYTNFKMIKIKNISVKIKILNSFSTPSLSYIWVKRKI